MVRVISPSAPNSAVHRNPPPSGGITFGCSNSAVLPVVLTVTVAVEDEVPLSVSELGDTEQVAKLGAPLQLNVTF